MENFTGLQFLRSLSQLPKVILTTAYDNYALEAFNLDVCDYLLKPISFERFLKSVNKVYDLHANQTQVRKQFPDEQKSELDFFFVKTDYRMEKVQFNDILYVEGQREYLKIVTGTKGIMTLMTFKKLQSLLPSDFVRIHNSFVVPLNKIESIENQQVRIGSKYFPISNSYKDRFYEVLKRRNIM